MLCRNCGRELPEGSAFCDGCGARQAADAQESAYAQAIPVAPTPAAPVVNNYYAPLKQPISVAGWIGRSLISCIPIVGWLVYLIMLFIWSGDQTKEESFNNWAKAQLWCMLIGTILVAIVAVIIFIIVLNAQVIVRPSYGGAYAFS